MDEKLKIFENPRFGTIRTAGTSENPMFCLADIGRVLEIKNVRDWKSRLKQDGVVSIYTPTESGDQQMVFINEQNLYKVIMRSDKPQAEAFQDWVCGEVLPSIRKNGGYISATAEETPEEIMAKALQIAQATIERKEKRIADLQQQKMILEGQTEQQQKQIGELAPKAEYTDTVLMSTTTYTMTEVAKEFGYSANTFSKKLRDCGILFYQSGRWMLTAKYQGQGFMNTRTHQFYHNDGTVGTNTISVWTEKGRKFLHDFRNGKFRSTRGNAQNVQPLN